MKKWMNIAIGGAKVRGEIVSWNIDSDFLMVRVENPPGHRAPFTTYPVRRKVRCVYAGDDGNWFQKKKTARMWRKSMGRVAWILGD